MDIHTIKCVMDLDILRCKTPEMVRKELWAGIVSYNLIRRTILQATSASSCEHAGDHGVEADDDDGGRTPREVSFTAVLQKVAESWTTVLVCQSETRESLIRRHLSDLLGHRIGHRPDRVEPRAIKRRPKSQKLLTEPREQARSKLGPDGGGNSTACSPAAVATAEEEMAAALAEEARIITEGLT